MKKNIDRTGKKDFKKMFAAIFFAVILIVSVISIVRGELYADEIGDISDIAEEELNQDIADWTIINWIMGDNDLRAQAEGDLIEMANAGSDDNVNMMAFYDWGHPTSSPPRPLGIYHVMPGNPVLVEEFDQPIMSDPAKITWTLEYIRDNYPANHYQLIIWNHGCGVRSLGQDWNDGSTVIGEYAQLWMDQMDEVLRNFYETTGEKMDIMMFDSCLMAKMEVAYSISKYADFMVASAFEIPVNSRNYATTLTKLKNNPTMSPRDLAALWVTDSPSSNTQSAVDLRVVQEIMNDWQEFSKELLLALPTHHSTIRAARSASDDFAPRYEGGGAISTNVDMKDFLDELVARDIPTSLEEKANVIRNKWGDFAIASNGGEHITIFYPRTTWPDYYQAHMYSRYTAGIWGYYRNGEKAVMLNEESYPYNDPEVWSDQHGDMASIELEATTPFNKYWHGFLYADWALDVGDQHDVSVYLPDGYSWVSNQGFLSRVDTVWCPEFTQLGVKAPFQAHVRNIAGTTVEATVTLSINDSPVKSEVVELLPGEIREVRIWYAIDTVGEHDVTITASLGGPINPSVNQGSHRTVTTDKSVLVIGNDVNTYGSNPSNPGSAHQSYLSALDSAGIGYEFWCYVENQGHTWWDRVTRGGIINENSLKPFDTVIYVTGGTAKNNHYTIAHWDLETLYKYLHNDGGGLILADPNFESSNLNFYDMMQFYKGPFGMEYQGNNLGTSIQGVGGDPISDGMTFSLSTSGLSHVEPWAPFYKDSYSDVFLTDTSGRGAGIKADTGTYRTVYMGFCISQVSGSADRAQLLSNAVDWVSSGERLNHYVFGRTDSYGAAVTLTNDRTEEVLYATTDEFGFYRVNIANLPSGYLEGDIIVVEQDGTLLGGVEVDRTNSEQVVGVLGISPTITITNPQGGEEFDAGTMQAISWITEEGDDPIESIDLWYSANGGSSWIPITSGIPDNSPYMWEVPNVDSEDCLIRGRVHDVLGRSGDYTMDTSFTINGLPPAPPVSLVVDQLGETEPQVVFEEDFTGLSEGTIPSGWTRSHTHWGAVNTNEAGGVAPELRYLGSGSTSATYRCYTPAIDTTGYTELDLSFTHRYYHMIGSITLRVEVSTDGSSWSTLWQHTGGSTGPAVVDLTLDTTDGVGSSTLYLAWTFVGRSNDARRWVIDDINLSTEVLGEGTEHNLVIWGASPEDPGLISHYNIYRSENYGGPWETPIASIPATGEDSYEYVDEGKGSADETLWWYVVRSENIYGIEEQNTDAVQEPGAEYQTYDIPLTAAGEAEGWNFVSFNLIPANTDLETILDDIDGSYDRVMYYDASTGQWSSYMPGRAARYNNLQRWNHQMGLWIRATSSITLTIEGSLPTTTDISLHPGWNMVGLPSDTSGTHGIPAEVDRVGYFDATQNNNIAYNYDPSSFIFEPGKAYMVHNPTSTTLNWEVDY